MSSVRHLEQRLFMMSKESPIWTKHWTSLSIIILPRRFYFPVGSVYALYQSYRNITKITTFQNKCFLALKKKNKKYFKTVDFLLLKKWNSF